MAGAETFNCQEPFEVCENDCPSTQIRNDVDTENGPSSKDQEQGLLLTSDKGLSDDLFGSDSEDSLFGNSNFKDLFSGSELFGESEGESCKIGVQPQVDSDLALPSPHDFDDDDDWPAPPDLCETSDVLSAVRNLALENFDIILQRTVRERSSELSELQNSARPVTGTNARDNLSDFFTRAISGDAEPNRDEGRSLPDDVQNLIQRSIVTSALRRHGFRSALEQSLASRLARPTVVRTNMISQAPSVRSASGMSTPSISQPEADAMSTVSEVFTDHNDNSDAASDIEQLQRVLDAGVQVLSETIEEDLQQLHHLHVVSSVLDGAFRDNLERLFQERARRVGGGEVVEQFIRSLPSASRPPRTSNATPRNGTANARTSFSSQLNQRSQNLQLNAEIATLKQQMTEMKEMLRMTMEMQMDTQRAIRQEVSAVFGAFMQQMSEAASNGLPPHQTSTPSRDPVPVSAGSCVICLDRQVDAVFYQCGHMCACHMCGMQLKMQGHKCPMCRAPIRDVIRAYKTQ